MLTSGSNRSLKVANIQVWQMREIFFRKTILDFNKNPSAARTYNDCAVCGHSELSKENA